MSATVTRSEVRTITLKTDVVLVWRHPRTPTMDLDISRSAGSQVSYYSEDHGAFIRHVCFVEEDGRRYEYAKDTAKPALPLTYTMPKEDTSNPAPKLVTYPVSMIEAPLPAPVVEVKAPVSTLETQRAFQATAERSARACSRIVNRLGTFTTVPQTQEEWTIERLEQAATMIENEDIYILHYYIPETLNGECPNPSALLWRIGACRMDLSGWLVTGSTLNSPRMEALFSHWRKFALQGLTFNPFKLADDQKAMVKAIVRAEIDKRLTEIHTSLIASLESASKRLAEAQTAIEGKIKEGEEVTQKQQEAPYNAYIQGVRQTLNKAIESFDGAIQAAQAFDETMANADLFRARRQVIEAEALAFNALMRTIGRKPVDLTPLG